MATIRLIPSTYYVNNSSYVTVTNDTNMYTNTDSTTYASVQNTRNSTSNTYYCYIRGFNFSSVPADATVNSFSIKIKASESYMSTSSSYRMSLYNNTTSISSTTVTSSLSTTATVFTFPIPTSLTWDTLKNYGSNFGIRIPLRRSSTNSSSYVYVYGAEIEVDYTVPVYHDISVSGSNVEPSGTSSILEGESLTIKCFDSTKPTVTDNGNDVTSQLVQATETDASYEVVNVGTYGFTLSNNYYVSNNKGIDKSAAVCRVDIHVPVTATVTFTFINYAEATYDFGVFGNLDVALSNNYYAAGSNGATITDSSYKLACNTSTYNKSSTQTLSYSNVSAGDHSIWVKYSKDDGTASNNDTLQFQVSITLNESWTPRTYWGYTLTNITADHTIVVTAGGGTTKTLYFKNNGTWIEATKVYKKINGSWVEQTDLTNVFNSQTNYVKG